MNHRRGRDGLPDISFARPSLLETNEDGGLEEIYEIKKAFGDDKATNLYLPEVSETSISIFLREAYLVVYQTQMGKRFPIYWEHACLPPIFSTNQQIWPKTAFLLDEICHTSYSVGRASRIVNLDKPSQDQTRDKHHRKLTLYF